MDGENELLFTEIPAVICALDNKSWPPHTYFENPEIKKEFGKLPWVELTLKNHGKPSILPLERYIDKKMGEMNVRFGLLVIVLSFFSCSYYFVLLTPRAIWLSQLIKFAILFLIRSIDKNIGEII